MLRFATFLLPILLSFTSIAESKSDAIVIGTKVVTEEIILGELAAQILESESFRVDRKLGLGGTGILFQAIQNKGVDLYVDYSGTLAEAVLKIDGKSGFETVRKGMKEHHLLISDSLGFENAYAMAIRRELADEYGLEKVSDLRKIQDQIEVGFSHEFMSRRDGLPGLTKHYGLNFGSRVRSIEHVLGYQAIAANRIDLMDAFMTDAKLEKIDLKILKDDLGFFPRYEAVFVAHQDFVKKHPEAWIALKKFEGRLSEDQMRRLNAKVDLEHQSVSSVVAEFLGTEKKTLGKTASVWGRVWVRTLEHLYLVGLSVFYAVLIGLPLGVVASKMPRFGQGILLVSGMVQTIPSLALLCFLIPIFGIGTKPALVALFLYGLLPVVLNTFVGISGIDSRLRETAVALGLTPWQRLRMIEFPIASQSIMAGVRTTLVIGIGIATLAALIGAGGYGVPIVTGLAMNNIESVLAGAIPAAVMALVVHFLFEVLGKAFIPKGLR